MIEEITRVVDGEEIVIGYASMMYPSTSSEKNTVFRMLRLKSDDPKEEGDIFFFKMIQGDWILMTEFAFTNLNSPAQLFNFYQSIERGNKILFDRFVDQIALQLGNEGRFSIDDWGDFVFF